MTITNQKLAEDCLTLVANAGQFLCRETGRTITAITESDLVEGLRAKGWKNLSGWNRPLNFMTGLGFREVVAKASRNGGVRGDWVALYSDGSTGRTVSKSTVMFTL